MSTLIKGDKIKIPTLSEDVILESDIEGYDVKIHKDCVLNTIQNSITIEIDGQLYTKSNCVVNEESVSIILNSAYTDGNSIISISLLSNFKDDEYYYFIIKMIMLNGSTPDNSTPDWNAHESEAGHIENRPFRFINAYGAEYQFNNPLKEEDFEAVPNEYGEVYKYRKPTNAANIYHVVCNKMLSYDGQLFTVAFYPIDRVDGKYFIGMGEHSAYIYIEEGDWDNGDTNNWLIVEMDYDGMFLPENSVFVITDEEDLVSYVSAYIPNVVKTIPQTLSNAEKNQAKENLGISTPDWNAQSGEAGYIENKPFYKIATANEYSCTFINFDGELEIFGSENIYADRGDLIGFSYGDVVNLYFFDGIIHNSEKIPVIRTNKPIQFVCSDENNLISKTYLISFPDMYRGQFDLTLTPHHHEAPDGPIGYYLTVKIDNYNGINYARTFTFGTEYVLDQQKLDISNIESALSYAPQRLSNDNKNQALANLGIDPVVWKFLCNPAILDYNEDEKYSDGCVLGERAYELLDYIFLNQDKKMALLNTLIFGKHRIVNIEGNGGSDEGHIGVITLDNGDEIVMTDSADDDYYFEEYNPA